MHVHIGLTSEPGDCYLEALLRIESASECKKVFVARTHIHTRRGQRDADRLRGGNEHFPHGEKHANRALERSDD